MNLSLNPTHTTTTTPEMTINNDGQSRQASAGTEPETTNPRKISQNLARPPFNLNNAAEVLISSLSQNGGKVEDLQILSKNTQQDLTRIDNQTETDTFVAKFQGTLITISIEKDLIPTALGGKKDEKIGIPHKITIESDNGSATRTRRDLGDDNAYIGEGKLNLINFNLNKLVPKETK
jgi:hypothetical protein